MIDQCLYIKFVTKIKEEHSLHQGHQVQYYLSRVFYTLKEYDNIETAFIYTVIMSNDFCNKNRINRDQSVNCSPPYTFAKMDVGLPHKLKGN